MRPGPLGQSRDWMRNELTRRAGGQEPLTAWGGFQAPPPPKAVFPGGAAPQLALGWACAYALSLEDNLPSALMTLWSFDKSHGGC